MKTLHEYEPFLAPYVPDSGLTALDIGANRGIWSRFLAERFHEVYAFEPNPRVLSELKQGLPSNVIVLQIALWSFATTRKFSVYPPTELFLESSLDASYIKDDSKIGEDSIQCMPLDSLDIPTSIDFMKIDTEGAEFEVLRGAAKTLWRSLPPMVIEVHNALDEMAIPDFLHRFHYQVDKIGPPYGQSWLYAH